MISRREQPSARILAGSTVALGLRGHLPLAGAFRTSALTRSAIRLRSSSSTTPSTVNTILPGVAFRSTFCKSLEQLQADASSAWCKSLARSYGFDSGIARTVTSLPLRISSSRSHTWPCGPLI